MPYSDMLLLFFCFPLHQAAAPPPSPPPKFTALGGGTFSRRKKNKIRIGVLVLWLDNYVTCYVYALALLTRIMSVDKSVTTISRALMIPQVLS